MGSSETGGPHLTIFYSGTVNVYDHVPAEKAHAIMLLLSGCSSSNQGSAISSSTTSDHDQMRAAEETPDPSKTLLASSSSSPSSTINTVSCVSTVGSSLTAAPAAAFLPLCLPSTAPDPSVNASHTKAQLHRTQQSRAPKRVRSQAELPFARKASLARFLQKRKDRLEATKVEEALPVVDGDESPRSSNNASLPLVF